MSEELAGGNGLFIGSPYPFAAPDGYVDHEYAAAGTATAYEPKSELTDDGRWSFAQSTSAAYRTRKGNISGTGKLDFDAAAGRFRKSAFQIRADVRETLLGAPDTPDEPKEIITAVKVDVSVDLLPAAKGSGATAADKKDKQ